MKLTHILPAIIATAIFTFTGCNKAPDEKTALANFKADVEGFAKWADEKGKAAKSDPAAGMKMMGELVDKLKAIKTDGLPADLKGAWGEFSGVLGEMADIFKGVKLDKPDDAMKVMGDLMPKITAVQGKLEPVMKKLTEVGKKYELDMTKVGPK